MRILHIEITGAYTEDMTYQNNLLSEQNLIDGHTVRFIANTQVYDGNRLVQTLPCNKTLKNGLNLIRLQYGQFFTTGISDKIRRVEGLYNLIEDFLPDVILCHGTQFWSILDVICYKKTHPEVKLYADSHSDSNNSGTNWLSLHILHRVFYRYLTQKALPYLEKYFVISEESGMFNHENYGVPNELMEFYPLGGIVPTEEEYAQRRACRRKELGISEENTLFVHSGKLDALKRTEELLKAFAAVPEASFRLVIIGSIPEEQKGTLLPLISADSRVSYLGWKSAKELLEYLCACDVYCQPGGQSATMQNAVCCGCAMMLYPHLSHTKSYDYGNIFWVQTQSDMEQTFREIAHNLDRLAPMKENSWRCARELLDYRSLAARLYR